jgi:hypothetical protein
MTPNQNLPGSRVSHPNFIHRTAQVLKSISMYETCPETNKQANNLHFSLIILLCSKLFFLSRTRYTPSHTCHKHIHSVKSQSSHCTKSKTCITLSNSEISPFKITVSKGHFTFSIIQKFSRMSFVAWEPHIAMPVLSPEHVGISYVGVFSEPSPKSPDFTQI